MWPQSRMWLGKMTVLIELIELIGSLEWYAVRAGLEL